MIRREVICDARQAQEIVDLLSTMSNREFEICQFIIDQDVMNLSIWIGENINFYPHPLSWVPRQLHHSGDDRELQYLAETSREIDEPVWGDETESQLDLDLTAEDIPRPCNNEEAISGQIRASDSVKDESAAVVQIHQQATAPTETSL